NAPAQALYRKWGFSVQGVRRRYYSDNNEDAHIMWSRALSDDPYQAELVELRTRLLARLAGQVADLPPAPPPVEAARHAGRGPWEAGKR
ncbi:MAG: hypothetical protein IT337_05680, partial [Thermomicrobiales bacterium]|nr:hypothetical protein [Thermomicrobiales bacterium]